MEYFQREYSSGTLNSANAIRSLRLQCVVCPIIERAAQRHLHAFRSSRTIERTVLKYHPILRTCPEQALVLQVWNASVYFLAEKF